MTAIQRVRRTRQLLGVGAATQALAWGLAAALGTLAAISFAALAAPKLEGNSEWHFIVAALVGTVVFLAFVWRERHLASIQRVALWIEERVPELQYALVTAIEDERSDFTDGMERVVERQEIGRVTAAALRKRLLPAVGAALAAGLLLYVSPSAAFGGGSFFPRLGAARSSAAIPVGSRLENLEVRVTPPAYSGQRTTTLDDPSSVAAIVGSRITIVGKGSSSGVTASVPSTVLSVVANGDGWSTALPMPVKPAALTLKDRGYDRIIVLDPRPDNPPKVVLSSPARDTTLRVARLTIQLNAAANDDIGLSAGYFEYLISTGSGEVFSAKTITTPVVHFGGSRTGTLNATLDLASLKLNQGDVVSIRAIVQDANTLSGPGLATSDTRTFRIARADEYDSVAVDAAAPLPVDTAAMSQRMLIMMTEKLVKEQKKLTRKELVRRSGEIGDLEDKIRKRVHEILFEIEGGGAEEEEAAAPGTTPDPTATLEGEESDQVHQLQNPDLFEAYNALWAAVRSLQIAEPEPALPPMRQALKALDRARLANRLYLRGIPPKVIVDLSRVRMTGKEKGVANTRTPRTAADSARADLERRFAAAIEMIPRQPQNAIRELTMLQVAGLSTSPAFASSLGEAIDAFRKGRDATLPLLRARRALSGDPKGAPGLPAWSGGW
jgi:hypothetical protein